MPIEFILLKFKLLRYLNTLHKLPLKNKYKIKWTKTTSDIGGWL